MVAPIFITLIKVYLFKKIAIYYTAKQYGFNLIYKRLLEGMKLINLSKNQQKIVSKNIKEAMRFPTNSLKYLNEINTSEFIIKYFDNIEQFSNKNIPEIMFNIKDVLYYKIPVVGRIIDILKIKK